jgi:hypothetical protein
MDSELNTQAMELSFTILEDIIMIRPLTNKEDIMELARTAKNDVDISSEYPQVLKLAYKEMVNKLQSLTFEEVKEIREIIED